MPGVARVGFMVVLLTCAAVAAARGEDVPGKPITIMVGLAPGGITDVTARLYAEAVSRNTGQRITIENRPAAAGALAAAAVQNAPHDVAQYQTFANGAIVYTVDYGAVLLSQVLLDKWLSLESENTLAIWTSWNSSPRSRGGS